MFVLFPGGSDAGILKASVHISDSDENDSHQYKPLLKTDAIGGSNNINQKSGVSQQQPLRTTNQHGLSGIDISGFAFPSGFSFGGTMGSVMQPDYNELTVSFTPPHQHSQSSSSSIHRDEIGAHHHQQFDTLSIDDTNPNVGENIIIDNERDLMHQTMLQFGTDNNTIVTSQTGSTALLPCIVNNIGEGMVRFSFYTYILHITVTMFSLPCNNRSIQK